MSDPKRSKGGAAPPDEAEAREEAPAAPEPQHRVYVRVLPDATDEEIDAIAERFFEALFGPGPGRTH
jgi:hypothetical protein